jgi:hypothetical protein
VSTVPLFKLLEQDFLSAFAPQRGIIAPLSHARGTHLSRQLAKISHQAATFFNPSRQLGFTADLAIPSPVPSTGSDRVSASFPIISFLIIGLSLSISTARHSGRGRAKRRYGILLSIFYGEAMPKNSPNAKGRPDTQAAGEEETDACTNRLHAEHHDKRGDAETARSRAR